MSKKIVFVLGLASILLVTLLSGCEEQTNIQPPQNQSEQESQGEQEQNQTQEENIVEISAHELAIEVKNNTLKTNAKYINKTMKINGIVNNTGVDIFGNTWVNLETGVNTTFGKWLIHCSVRDDFIQEVAGLNKGDETTIQGIYTRTALDMIWLDNCTLVS